MSHSLLFLVGNRDVQFRKEQEGNLPPELIGHLVTNNELGVETLVVDKGKTASQTFLETSEMIWEERDYLLSFIYPPMLLRTIEIMEEKGKVPNKVYISTSQQHPPHRQDCYYFAQLLQKYLGNEGFDVELRLCKENPNDFSKMVVFYRHLFDELQKMGNTLTVSNSGGTPTMRSASQFAAIFRGIDFITIGAEQQYNLETFQRQESMVLQRIVSSMLEVFDYEGILRLPIPDKAEISSLSAYAIARLNLNFEGAREISETGEGDFWKELREGIEEEGNLKVLERETYLSANIKYHQKAWADYLWRIFTIYDNLLIPIIELKLGGEIIYDKESNHRAWKDLLGREEGLIRYLENKEFAGKPLVWEYPNKFSFEAIFRFYYPKNSQNKLEEIEQLLKGMNQLSGLRNAIAHNYSGITLEKMKGSMPKKLPLEKFNELLGVHTGIPWDDFGVYQKINNTIMEILMK